LVGGPAGTQPSHTAIGDTPQPVAQLSWCRAAELIGETPQDDSLALQKANLTRLCDRLGSPSGERKPDSGSDRKQHQQGQQEPPATVAPAARRPNIDL